MTPPRKTAEPPGTSVIRCPMSPPVLDSATASVRRRRDRSPTASAASRALFMLSMPPNAAPNGLLQRDLWLPTEFATELRGVLPVVVGEETDREAREFRAHLPPAPEPTPRLEKHPERISQPQGEFSLRRPLAGRLGDGLEQALLGYTL